MARLLLCGVLMLSFPVLAQNKDDGFVWLDANTKIKVKKTADGAAGGASAPEKAPKKARKKAEPRK